MGVQPCCAYPTRPHADSSLQVPLSESDRDLLRRRRRITGFSPASREICRVERTAAVEYQSVEEKIRGSTKRAYVMGGQPKKGRHTYTPCLAGAKKKERKNAGARVVAEKREELHVRAVAGRAGQPSG